VAAYHGCHKDVAERLLSSEPFRASINEYDWLGPGVYFWEYAPYRALEWARRRFAEDAAVIEATLALGHCLNLMDSPYFARLQTAYGKVVLGLQAEGMSIPENQHGKHILDSLVVDKVCTIYTEETGTSFETVRGCFPEGKPVFDGSQILRYTHVQIAVRDEHCISRLKLVHFT